MRIVHRAIAGFRLKQAGLKRAAADTGAVTLIQRFGSAANLDIQLHGLVPDGVYRRTGGEPVFQQARALVLKLGLPREMVLRHPFPGPGPGVRILGEVKPEYAALLQRADAVFIEEPRNTPVSPSPLGEGRGEVPANWYDKVAQAFAVFLPMRSVGVMGDGRTYDCVVALRAVQTTDFMTAHWAELPHDLLGRVSNRTTARFGASTAWCTTSRRSPGDHRVGLGGETARWGSIQPRRRRAVRLPRDAEGAPHG